MKIVVPIAEGVEEMEAVIIVDVLRRAGWEVVMPSLGPSSVRASRGVVLLPDCPLGELDRAEYDGLLLPGGVEGTRNLCGSPLVLAWIRDFTAAGKLLGAICAAPRVLYEAGVLRGKRGTCYPGHEKDMPDMHHVEEPVVWDGHVVTSRAVGTAFPFALSIVERFEGDEAARRLAAGLLLPWGG
jgi:protein deglycase